LWLRVVQAIVFTALAVLAFVQLARVARPVRAAVLDGY
jgi:ABC-type dipeptide/oligopeptide/nickel transport system permease subunit